MPRQRKRVWIGLLGRYLVLDWRHIARWSRSLGPDVSVMAFPGAMHDVTLSRPEIRDEVFRQLFSWAERAVMSPA